MFLESYWLVCDTVTAQAVSLLASFVGVAFSSKKKRFFNFLWTRSTEHSNIASHSESNTNQLNGIRLPATLYTTHHMGYYIRKLKTKFVTEYRMTNEDKSVFFLRLKYNGDENSIIWCAGFFHLHLSDLFKTSFNKVLRVGCWKQQILSVTENYNRRLKMNILGHNDKFIISDTPLTSK